MEQENQNAFIEYDQKGQKTINLPTLTLLEQQQLNNAKQQHRQNITKEQRVGTKIFKGLAFIAKPNIILFKNFTLGKIHLLTLTLTNVSNAFNSFNVLPLPEKIRNFFEIEFTPKGKISPGISCEIKFKFIPQFNEDIDSEFSILSETGKISYPIKCTSKKTIVKCDNPVVDFGQIIFGEVGHATLSLRNEGTLPSQIVFQNTKGIPISKCEEESELELINQIKFDNNHQIQGNSLKIVNFQLKTKKIGIFQLILQIYTQNFVYSPPITVRFVGNCVEVPVRIQKTLYDFDICLLHHIYRQKLVFFNKGQTSMSFKMIQSAETRKYFEFNPVIGYIQKQSKMQVWIKLNTQKDLPANLGKYATQPNIYTIPFHMSVKEQLLPVNFSIKFQVTRDKIRVHPIELNFGTIYQGLSSKIEVTFQNQSDLPQEVLLYPLKKQIFVENDQPLLKLLPKESIKTFIIYRSKTLDQYGKPFKEEGSIPCKIITGDLAINEIKLDYFCETVRPDLFILNNKIDLPALQIDEFCNATTVIRNNSSKDIIFQIFVPHFLICGLKLTPVVKILTPKQQVQINIQYHSAIRKLTPKTFKQIADQLNKTDKQQVLKQQLIPVENKKESKKETKKETKLTKQQQQQLQLQQKMQEQAQKERKAKQEEERMVLQRNFNLQSQLNKLGGKMYDFGKVQHYRWLLPVYFKQKDYPDASAETNFIEVTTTATEKVLELDKMELNFGQIAVGGRDIKQIKILNKDQKISLQKKQLPIFCCFSVLNSMKQIEKDSRFSAIVQFQPTEEQTFQQRLTFFSQKNVVSCLLKGKGVRPEVTIDPESGLLNLGSVVLEQYAEKVFKIKNICNFQVQFSLKKICTGINNLSSSRAISYVPTNGSIQPNNSVEIKVRFKPDRLGQRFFEKIKVHVPEQKSEKYLYVWGACYPRQAYVLEYEPKKIPQTTQTTKKIEFAFDSLKIKDQDTIYGLSNKRIVLEYSTINDKNKENQLCYKRKIIVGSCKLLDNKLEKPTNFQIIMPKDDRFNCDNLKGTVSPGSESIITFIYKPQQIDPLIAKIDILSGVGQWKDIKAELKLSGGFVKAGATDQVSLQIILRVYVNQL